MKLFTQASNSFPSHWKRMLKRSTTAQRFDQWSICFFHLFFLIQTNESQTLNLTYYTCSKLCKSTLFFWAHTLDQSGRNSAANNPLDHPCHQGSRCSSFRSFQSLWLCSWIAAIVPSETDCSGYHALRYWGVTTSHAACCIRITFPIRRTWSCHCRPLLLLRIWINRGQCCHHIWARKCGCTSRFYRIRLYFDNFGTLKSRP